MPENWLVLLTLCEAIGFLFTPHVQQLGRTDLEVAAEAHVKTQDVLLVERFTIERFEANIVYVHQVGVHGTCRPYLRTAVADVHKLELHTCMTLTLGSDRQGLFVAFNEHINPYDIFLHRFLRLHHSILFQLEWSGSTGLVRHNFLGVVSGLLTEVADDGFGKLGGVGRSR